MIWCLHGAVGQAADWDDFSKAMAGEGRTCRAVDLWRFLECEGISLQRWAAVFNSEVKAAGEDENILVGYSMGGRLALHALLDSPELWKKAVIVSAHPGLLEELQKLERMADDAEWAGTALTGEWSQFLRKWDQQGILQSAAPPNPDPRMRLVNRRRAIARSFMEWSLGKQENLTPRFQEITSEVLWLTGSNDQKFTELAAQATSQLANATHEELPTSHRLPWQEPALFQKSVAEFLQQAQPS